MQDITEVGALSVPKRENIQCEEPKCLLWYVALREAIIRKTTCAM